MWTLDGQGTKTWNCLKGNPQNINLEMTTDSKRNRLTAAEKAGSRPWPPDDKKSPSSKKPFDGLTVTSAIPFVAGFAMKAFLGATVVLYVLNQKHALPKPLSAIVSKTLFWPTLPITASRRIGKWMTRIDDTVVMGGAPFGFLDYPETLHDKHGVRGVVNLCEEYRGPEKKYKWLGIEQLYLPTTDHFEPTLEDLLSAISFIKRHEAHGKQVYVHCRAGHGRSAAVVIAWLLYKNPEVQLEQLNKDLRMLRNVRKTLWQQPNILKLQSRLLEKGTILLDLHESASEDGENVINDKADTNKQGDDL